MEITMDSVFSCAVDVETNVYENNITVFLFLPSSLP